MSALCVAACWRETGAATLGNATKQQSIPALQQVQQSHINFHMTYVISGLSGPCCQALIATSRPCLCCLHNVALLSERHPSTTEGSTTAWGMLHSTHAGVGAMCKPRGPSVGCVAFAAHACSAAPTHRHPPRVGDQLVCLLCISRGLSLSLLQILSVAARFSGEVTEHGFSLLGTKLAQGTARSAERRVFTYLA